MVGGISQSLGQWSGLYEEADPTHLLALDVCGLHSPMKSCLIWTSQCVMGYCMWQHVPALWKYPKIAVQGPYYAREDLQEVNEDGSAVSRQDNGLAQATPMLYWDDQVSMQLLQPQGIGEIYLGAVDIGAAQFRGL